MEATRNESVDPTSVYTDAAPDILKIFATIFLILDGVLIFCLNPLCLVILTRRRLSSIQENAKIFLASLTVSDLGIGIFWVIPRSAEVLAGRWPFGEFLCVSYGAASSVFITTGVMSLLLLTLDRFLSIVHAMNYASLLTTFRARVIVCSVWAFSFVVNTLCFGILSPGQSIISEQVPHTCIWKDATYRQYLVMSFYVLALSTVVYSYTRIVIIARRQARRIAHENQLPENPDRQQPADYRHNLKAAKTILVIYAALVASWIPTLWESIATAGGDDDKFEGMKIFVDACLMSNSWMNVVIYYFRNEEFRRALHTLWNTDRHHQQD